jgi:hypothetical protein
LHYFDKMKKLTITCCIIVLQIGSEIAVYSQNLLYPRFEAHNIDTLRSGYKVEVEDINLDGKPDVAALASTPAALVWFENPGWQRHVISYNTYRNISMAFNDIDGDGKRDLALASHFELTEPDEGELNWLKGPPDPVGEWNITEVKKIPSIHRILWTDLNNDGRKELIIAPTLGPGAKAPEYKSKTAFYYAIVSNTGSFSFVTIDSSLTVLHGISVYDIDKNGTPDILTASFEGVSVYYNNLKSGAGGFIKRQIGIGEQKVAPQKGSSEVEAGHLANGKIFIATIEPWHGNQVVVYFQEANPDNLWTRVVIDPTFNQGHALAVADFNGDGTDEIVAGYRGRGTSLFVYVNRDTDGRVWERTLLDNKMATSGISISDINNDGKPDIVAIGTSTNNIRWYENKGFIPVADTIKVSHTIQK